MSTDDLQDEPLSQDAPAAPPAHPGEYVVVARRYRPQTFDELIGQEQVATALGNAIATDRVGHAYLFTGARGVGKTSAARILAKALNCQQGPTPTPCNRCDNCRSIAAGDDLDVLEIDGASNRGIDEIRQLRANVDKRPSARSRFKIYIIDEVHMLTPQAFNALLKTLEEPPGHVKFIFCTTDPEKIPITVLSRCQRFDFAGIRAEAIAERLGQIVRAEGIEVDAEALTLLARRAAGSMRDSQSLLEQLLSYGGRKITAAEVHALLGTAAAGRLAELAARLIDRDAAAALGELDAALAEGADAGQLMLQLIGYFRDMMAAAVGCGAELMLYTSPAEHDEVRRASSRYGLETILAAVQILDRALVRMRQSTHGRTLAEMAIVRVAKLEDLEELSTLIARVEQSGPVEVGAPAKSARGASAEKKTADVTDSAPARVPSAQQTVATAAGPRPVRSLTAESAKEIWDEALRNLGDMTAGAASRYERVAISGPNRLVVSFPARYDFHKSSCERPKQQAQLEQAVAAVVGEPVKVEFQLLPDDQPAAARRQAGASPRQQKQQIASHPMVRRTVELFDAEVLGVEPGRSEPDR